MATYEESQHIVTTKKRTYNDLFELLEDVQTFAQNRDLNITPFSEALDRYIGFSATEYHESGDETVYVWQAGLRHVKQAILSSPNARGALTAMGREALAKKLSKGEAPAWCSTPRG